MICAEQACQRGPAAGGAAVISGRANHQGKRIAAKKIACGHCGSAEWGHVGIMVNNRRWQAGPLPVAAPTSDLGWKAIALNFSDVTGKSRNALLPPRSNDAGSYHQYNREMRNPKDSQWLGVCGEGPRFIAWAKGLSREIGTRTHLRSTAIRRPNHEARKLRRNYPGRLPGSDLPGRRGFRRILGANRRIFFFFFSFAALAVFLGPRRRHAHLPVRFFRVDGGFAEISSRASLASLVRQDARPCAHSSHHGRVPGPHPDGARPVGRRVSKDEASDCKLLIV